MTKKNLVSISLAASTFVIAALNPVSTALAQSAVDATNKGRDSFREQERLNPLLQAPQKDLPSLTVEPAQPASMASSVKINVKEFRITGATLFPASDLMLLVQDFVGQELTLEQLREAAARISNYYRQQGLLVSRAYLPAQKITDGVVEIAVLEGTVGKLLLNNSSRVSDASIRNFLSPVTGNGAISNTELERSLILINELPGVSSAVAALQPGETIGSSDITVLAQPAPLFSGNVDVDNYGSRYTGSQRLGVSAALNSPLKRGDRLSFRTQTSTNSQGTDYSRLSYQLPVGSRGLVLGTAFAKSDYRVGREFTPLQSNGSSIVRGVFAHYPLVRRANFSLSTSLNIEHKVLEDRTDSVDQVYVTTVQPNTLSLFGNLKTEANANYSFNVSYTSGRVNLKTGDQRAIDAASANTQGHYGKFNLSADGSLPLASPAWSLYGSISAQKAQKNLDSSENFSLGGASGVRAYPSGEATGNEGYLVKAEVHYLLSVAAIPGVLEGVGFIDHGGVRTNHSPFTAGVDNARKISAIGLGLNWEVPGNFIIKSSIARRLGNAASTADTDTSTVRGWIQGVKYF